MGAILDFKLIFEDHVNNVLAKVNKAVGFLHRLRNSLSRKTLIIVHRAFIMDYGDVLYDQAFNNSFKGKLESTQYDPCLALTAAIKYTSKEISQKLGLESVRDRRWCRKLFLFF